MYNIIHNSVLAEFRRSAGNPDALIGAFEAPTITEVPQILAVVNLPVTSQGKFKKDRPFYL